MTRIHIAIPMRWGDQDAFGHLNNVTLQQLLEEARVRAFWLHEEPSESLPSAVFDPDLRVGGEGPFATLIAQQSVEYLAPVSYRQRPLDIDLWFGRLGGASAEICYEVRGGEREGHAIFARATTTLVLTDRASMRPVRLPSAVRSAWEPFVEAPVVLRRA